MVLMAWILLIFFGFLALVNTRKYMLSSLNKLELCLWISSVLISSLCAGIIWGGINLL